MISRLPEFIPEIDIYALPIVGTGREAERRAVARLATEILGSHILHRPDGSPYAEADPTLPISISHGAATALLAVGRREGMSIGVDIESTRRTDQLTRVSRRFASQEEQRYLSLLEIWTAKEAVYKAMGLPGLSLTDIKIDAGGAATAAGRELRVAWIPFGSEALISIAQPIRR